VSAMQEARIMTLRAVLARIAEGQPAHELTPERAQQHLHLAQRAAALAVEDDLKEAAREHG
jgi:hypothetical protein